MYSARCYIGFMLLLSMMGAACKKEYFPPVLKSSNQYLVIDGFINTGTNAITTITLSRTTNLKDTVTNVSEPGATMNIESQNGNFYPLTSSGQNGVYKTDVLSLDNSQRFKLNITTGDGRAYVSDFVESKTSPLIDSVTWKTLTDPLTDTQKVTVYVNAHDPESKTHYYRWDFVETYEYHASYNSAWHLVGDRVLPYDLGDGAWICYSSRNSSNIYIGSTIALSQDLVSMQPLQTLLKNDERLDVRYSILVNQYPLTPDGYNYWQIIQKNSEQLGSLFDLQPSQLSGNIHSVTDPSEPVIGFISANTVTSSRIFISNLELPNWHSFPFTNCPVTAALTNPNDLLAYLVTDDELGPYYFSGGSLYVSKRNCLDCRYRGGTLTKPTFW